MKVTRREAVATLAGGLLAQAHRGGATHFVRFSHHGGIDYGVLEDDYIRPLSGDIFGEHKVWSARFSLDDVKLLFPCEPRKIFAVGLNYRSHIGDRPVPKRPEIFYKPVSALQNPEDPVVFPPGAKNVHYEGELVLVAGRRLKNASESEARAAIFGVTCGNDVTERDWQGGPDKDLQWWRAKGADTFAPVGPAIVAGLDYGKLLLQTRLNGRVVQKQYTSDLIFDPPAIVSWISRYVTIETGDLIFTGTPGKTSAMKPGDVVEVEIEGIGVLRNPVRGG